MSHLEELEFAENPEPRCPCVLLLDTSSSMTGHPIDELNRGLRVFAEELSSDRLASLRVEVAIVTFDTDVRVVQDFVTADRFHPPVLSASGTTAMGRGILRALDLVTERKRTYRQHGITYYRPWIFMITDGAPTDHEVIGQAAQHLRHAEERKEVAFFAVGVEGADMERLAQISVRPPAKLRELAFRELFLWLSKSLTSVSASAVGSQIVLPSREGWEAVDV